MRGSNPEEIALKPLHFKLPGQVLITDGQENLSFYNSYEFV